MKKKILIPLFLAIVCLTVGIAGGLLISLKKNTEKNTSPDYYFSKSEQIPSVTGIVGERSLIPSSETAPSNEPISAPAASQPFSESQSLESQASESSAVVYKYYSNTVEQDVKDYVEYLKSEKNFIDISDVETDESNSASYHLAGASQDEDAYLSIAISETSDSYTVTTTKESEPWYSYVTELWNNSRKQTSVSSPHPTMVSAEDQVRSSTQQFLNLSRPVSDYKFIAQRGLININGTDYYCVSAYLPNETGTFDYECAFLLDASSGTITYQYNESTGQTLHLQ